MTAHTSALRVVRDLQVNQPDTPAIHKMLRGALLITETAAVEHLPTPLQVTADNQTIQITLPTEDCFNVWAIWLDATVEPVFPMDDYTTVYSAVAEQFGFQVVLQFSDLGGAWTA